MGLFAANNGHWRFQYYYISFPMLTMSVIRPPGPSVSCYLYLNTSHMRQVHFETSYLVFDVERAPLFLTVKLYRCQFVDFDKRWDEANASDSFLPVCRASNSSSAVSQRIMHGLDVMTGRLMDGKVWPVADIPSQTVYLDDEQAWARLMVDSERLMNSKKRDVVSLSSFNDSMTCANMKRPV